MYQTGRITRYVCVCKVDTYVRTYFTRITVCFIRTVYIVVVYTELKILSYCYTILFNSEVVMYYIAIQEYVMISVFIVCVCLCLLCVCVCLSVFIVYVCV